MNHISVRSGTRLLMLLVALAVLAMLAARLRGPVLPGYRVELRPLVQTVVATGRVISTSRSQVGSEVTGTVLERRVSEGDVVKAGDILAVLRADDLTARMREAEAALRQLQLATRPQAQAALQQAQVRLAQASRERQRRADLLARQLVAREVLEQAEEAEAVARTAVDRAQLAVDSAAPGRSEESQLRERLFAARAQLAKTNIRAGAAGTVLTRNVEPGDLVQPGRVLFEIARGGETEIQVPVDEKNLAALAPGQVAQCIADAYPDQPFAATVNYIAPGIDAQRGTVDIRLRVDPVPSFLRQDMTVSVNVETGRRAQALVVPNDALLDTNTAQPALLVVRNGRVHRVAAQLGLKGLVTTEILQGLQAGDQVLADAAAATRAKDGARVRMSIEPLPAANADGSSRRELPVAFD